MYAANGVPVLLGGGPPIDFKKKFVDHRPIFGKSKTWRGFWSAIFLGFITGVLVRHLLIPILHPLDQFTLPGDDWFGFYLGLGAMLGDLIGSFIKRRLNLKSGASAPILDQSGFAIMGLLVAKVVYPTLPWVYFFIVIPVSIIVHYTSNIIAYLLGWKKVPW